MTEGPYKLPKGWRWVRLGEVAYRESKTIKPAEEPSKIFRYLGMEHLDAGQWEEPIYVELEGAMIKSQAIIFYPGMVLYGKLRPYLNKVVIPTVEGVASTEFVPLLTNNNFLIPEYLGAYLRSPFFVSYASRNTSGSRQPRVQFGAFWDALIPLPPISEQKRILERINDLFSRIREAKRLRQEAQQEAERLWQSVLADTFPKPGTKLPEGWQWVGLYEVCQHKTGIWGPESSHPDQGLPIIRSTEIEGFLIRPQTASIRIVSNDRIEAFKLEAEDILVNKSSGSAHLVGWPAIFEGSIEGKIFLFSNFMLRLRPNREKILGWFLLYYLHNPLARSVYLRAQDTTSGLRNLRVNEFMKQLIPLPTLHEQHKIVAYLKRVYEKIQSLKEAQTQTEAELQRLEQAILDKAFRGEL